jgi:transcriptional regulator with XRE-family HTH domain
MPSPKITMPLGMAKSVHSSEYRQLLARLKSAREDAGLTQVQVAEKLKKPQSYVSKVEAGERRLDPIELSRFAKLYGKSVSYFVTQ